MCKPCKTCVFFVFLLALGRFCCGGEEGFSWRQCSGQTLRVLFNRHPYAEGMRRKLADFEKLTGIKVSFIIHPEARYFQELDKAFTGEATSPDVYMTGAYQVWSYAEQGRMAPLDPFVVNASLTRQGYNVHDFFPTISGAFRWNGKPGAVLGEGQLWAIPVGFEASSLTYNRELLAKYRVPVPETMEELITTGKAISAMEGEAGLFGVAARGAGEWNSLHSGYITTFVNYGAKDMEIENGRLVSRVNSPEAVAATELWIQMLKECCSPDWEFYDWYRCLEDIGNRRAAILFDSDFLGFNANAPGASPQSGKLGTAPPPVPSGTDPGRLKSNLWVWGLAINPDSVNINAAWLFVQYFTSREFQRFSVIEWNSVNPPRRSVFEDPAFQVILGTMNGYASTFSQIIDNTAVYFTPNPHFFDISERWAAVIRDIANGMYGSTQEGMDALKIWMDGKLSEVEVD